MKQRRMRRDVVLLIVGLVLGASSIWILRDREEPQRSKAEAPSQDVVAIADQNAPQRNDEETTAPTAKDPKRSRNEALADEDETPPEALPGSSITVETLWDGRVPERPLLDLDQHCGRFLNRTTIESDAFAIADGHLGGVLVYVDGILFSRTPPPVEPARISIRGCRFEPNVVALQTGQALELAALDNTGLAFRLTSEEYKVSIGLGASPSKWTRPFLKPQLSIPVVRGDFMRATVHVLDHPVFGVSDADHGIVELRGLPRGVYTIAALHPKLEPQSQVIDFDGKSAEVRFTFSTQSTTTSRLSKR